jgi:site-specific recombinase XerD
MDTNIELTELEDAFDRHMEASGRSKNTRKHYHYTVKDFHQFLMETNRAATLYSLNADCIREFSIWLSSTPTRAWRGSTQREVQSVHGRLRDIRAFTRWLEDEEIIDRAPKIALPKLPDRQFPIITENQVHQLLSCDHLSASGPQAIRNRALIALMLDTGIRRSEAAGIVMADLEIADQLIKIRGKGNNERRVPFSTGVVEALQRWLLVRGDEAGSLFWLTSNGVYSLFQRIQNETGLPIHPHQLRHQAATMMVRNNATRNIILA